MEPYIRQTPWDLVVIDEAHRLRNVYKPTNKIANAIKQAVAPFRKVLLTATPLQNSLLELYGLVSIIDDFAFGDLKTYRAQFTRLANDDDFNDLKERLQPICKRTLRKQVLEYVKYTNRHALVQEFVPTPEEQRLYDLVSEYLQQPTLYALPASQRSLMTLILRKLLASSTYAISDTLERPGLQARNRRQAGRGGRCAARATGRELGRARRTGRRVGAGRRRTSRSDDKPQLLARAARRNAAGNGQAPRVPRTGQVHRQEFQGRGAADRASPRLCRRRRGQQEHEGSATLQQKAIIFTESRRTQEYLFRILEQTEFAGKVMLFNGTNTDPASKEIYRRWLEQARKAPTASPARRRPTCAPRWSSTSATKRPS